MSLSIFISRVELDYRLRMSCSVCPFSKRARFMLVSEFYCEESFYPSRPSLLSEL